ncbi:MAG TPA: type VI secretion system tip protein VgrG [Bryobacteraceae bacterium]|jgi:type VI secretion system secreted protein VgrG|nr:type VI secretion system tip protein VgrG [Bryobacteraceae bacterium]
MASSFTQAQRPMRVYTPLGPDVLVLENIGGSEAISRPFEFRLDMLSENNSISASSLIRKPVHVEIDLASGASRFIHGRVSHFVQRGRKDMITSYQAVIRPWLWFLSLYRDCRIFQNMSVPDIVEKIFTDHGFTDFSLALYGSYSPREYCVQYRESSLDFVSRLLEEEGIFYYFRHSADKHELVLTDNVSGCDPCPDQSTARVWVEQTSSLEDDVIEKLEYTVAAEPGLVTLEDYNFTTPSNNLMVNAEGQDGEEIYDYPGKYDDRDAGERYARLRLEERETAEKIIRGSGGARAFIAGFTFTLQDHYREDLNVDYLITALRLTMKTSSFETTPEDRADYVNEFEAIPVSVPYRPPRLTPKPVIAGLQTAVVVGPSGEEIYCDQYGRVKVQFHWDRVGKRDEKSSCWVRVSQEWAGKNWGAIFLPRIGQEVIVEFLEGDPDRPLITGRVYNAEQMPPYALPAYQTQSGIKTRSSKGGSGSNCNELRFEDKMGSEMVLLHAEKDLTTEVEHDETRTVGNNRTTTITQNETKTVDQGNETITLNTGNQSIELKMGNQSTKADLGSISTEALQSITLKVGENSIVINQMGITISGLNITVQGQIQISAEAPIIEVTADGELSLTGSITMIN